MNYHLLRLLQLFVGQIASTSYYVYIYRCVGQVPHHTVDASNPAPVDMWFIPSLIGFQHVSTIQVGAGVCNHQDKIQPPHGHTSLK